MTASGAPDLSEEQVPIRQALAARRRAQPGRLRTAASFPQPLGPRFERGSVRGYYIDLRSKAQAVHWPPDWWLRHAEQQYIAVSQWGLGCFERFLAGDGEEWLRAASSCAGYLADQQQRDGAWLHLWPYPHTFELAPPWPSGMAQGEAASLLVRVHLETGEERLAAAARRALGPLEVASERGGVQAILDGRPFPEELPTDPPSYILNGAIYALWGYHDVGVGLGDDDALDRFQAGADMLAATIHHWDAGWWSRYDLHPHRMANLANPFYHRLHIDQLKAMQRLAPRPEVQAAIERFESYTSARLAPMKLYAHKAAFRTLSPRSPRLLAARRRLTAKR